MRMLASSAACQAGQRDLMRVRRQAKRLARPAGLSGSWRAFSIRSEIVRAALLETFLAETDTGFRPSGGACRF